MLHIHSHDIISCFRTAILHHYTCYMTVFAAADIENLSHEMEKLHCG